jgi:glutathione S-transferase
VLVDSGPANLGCLFDAWSPVADHVAHCCQLEALADYFSNKMQQPSPLAVGAVTSSQGVRGVVTVGVVMFRQQLQQQRNALPAGVTSQAQLSDAAVAALTSLLTCRDFIQSDSISSAKISVEILLACGGKGTAAVQAAIAEMLAKLPDQLLVSPTDPPVPQVLPLWMTRVMSSCLHIAEAANKQRKRLKKMLRQQEHKQAAAAAAAAVGSHPLTAGAAAAAGSSEVTSKLQIAVARADALLHSLQQLLVSDVVVAAVQRCLLHDWRVNDPGDVGGGLENWLKVVARLLGLEECHRQGASAEQDRAGHPAAAAAAATVVEVPPEGAAVAAALVQELLSKADNCLELLDCQDMTASPAHNDHVLRPFSLYTLLDQLVGRLRSGGLAAGGRSRSKRSLAVAPGGREHQAWQGPAAAAAAAGHWTGAAQVRGLKLSQGLK